MLVDPDGKSTKVTALEDGTYKVIGGDINDKDCNIYVYTQDENGDYSVKGESIGLSATLTSFYNSDEEDPSQRWGGIINPSDNSGKVFLNNIMGENSPNLFKYMYYARNGKNYDFKVTNGTDSEIQNINPQRGMPIGSNSDGSVTYASARDVGNMAAGYIAAKNGISWQAARKAFDCYQGGPEGKTTVNAELYGYVVLGYYTTAQRWIRQMNRKKIINLAVVMKKRYIVICLFLFLIVYLYINRNIYYISKWGMYIKIENVNDTTIVNISKTRWHWGDNYIKYRPESAEMTHLDLNPIKDTLYVIEHYMKIIETHIKDYKVKEVQFIRCYTQRDYWTDSTFIKEKPHDWIRINHRHGLRKSWE